MNGFQLLAIDPDVTADAIGVVGLLSTDLHAECLSHVTDSEVHCLVLSAPCKSSDLDPLPTGLVKDCIDVLVTPIVSIVNLSLSEGCFSTHFKSALVSPLLKKTHTQ